MNGRISGLDGIRAIAAVAVVFCHTVAGASQIGGYAVNIFFVLSGFLILNILHVERRAIDAGDRHFGVVLIGFWRRRIARICPAYYVVATVVLAVLAIRGQIGLAGIAYFLTYTQNFFISQTGEWTDFGYSWTLAVEQQFYLLFALLMLLIPARYHRSALGGSALCLLAVYIALVMARSIDLNALYVLPLGGFMLASAGGWAVLGGAPKGAWRMLTYGPVVALFALASVVLACLPAALIGTSATASAAQILFYLVGLTAIITYIANNQSSRAVALLELPLLRFYGTISYSLYLVLGAMARWLKEGWFRLDGVPHVVAFAVERLSLFSVVLLIGTALGYLSWRFVERPAMRQRSPVRVSGDTRTAVG